VDTNHSVIYIFRFSHPQEMIVQWDLDDKGTISFEGFLAMISSLTAVMDIEKELHSGKENLRIQLFHL
jgi:hypothetical protein